MGTELTIAIDELFPEKIRFSIDSKTPDELPTPPEKKIIIKSKRSGYLQAIDTETLLKLAMENDLIMQTMLRPGEFTAKDGALCIVWPDIADVSELEGDIEKSFILGDQRLRIQNVQYHINQLVEIAVRALSPGINDPFTAMSCIDQIGAGLAQLMERSIPTGYIYDENGALRLITKALTYTDIIEASFNQIRRNGKGSVSVNLKLLETIEMLVSHVKTGEQTAILKQQAEMIYLSCKENIAEWDFEYIEIGYKEFFASLEDDV